MLFDNLLYKHYHFIEDLSEIIQIFKSTDLVNPVIDVITGKTEAQNNYIVKEKKKDI